MADGITLTHPDTTSITLTSGLRVIRSVGRPNSELRRVPGQELHDYHDRVRSARDVFDISGAFLSGTAESDAHSLVEDIVRPLLGSDTLTLAFENGLYGYSSSFDVFPAGSAPTRISYGAGETGMVNVDTLSLRVVDNG